MKKLKAVFSKFNEKAKKNDGGCLCERANRDRFGNERVRGSCDW